MKIKNWLVLCASLVVGVLAAVGLHTYNTYSAQSAPDQITVGSQGSDYDVWQHIAASPQAKKLNLKITVKQISDGVQLNNATSENNVNVNAFQSYSYMQAYNKENPQHKLAVIGTTYLEPLGIYSDKYDSLKQIPTGATIALANNPANTARDLLLLQDAGLIKLKKNFGLLGNTNDIVENPRGLKFKEIDDTTGPRVLNSVDAVLISNTVALEGKLNVLHDSLYHEKINQSTRQNINILATAAGNQKKKVYQKLLKLYHEPVIQKYVKNQYHGTKIEVKKPISYLK
ncbi:NLPA lipoprotein [Ligilactobacillus acidipiscis DSM 15836]|uniref:NLPA lipoprotein n=1 Tax=Ligilactobacillus acidipiscis DSM 15836 TaxID=1423716 RepID=A0ABR5PJZ8_9LACO|nr:MetQ/NlpA family ABC transporter substrate-binding protein [Ligilactobacillus acidipiscis]KRM27437.1 NLPA lipoprotein [Ligilactobacillus acidipiscis DSM 15836]GAW64183.1 methionine ABC transporter substrate-binding protein [Ligilactobacillus acidipiscis]GEN20882.1 metal ABC transporter substrate-binding protein [Ligilactobacillus acidipiscis]